MGLETTSYNSPVGSLVGWQTSLFVGAPLGIQCLKIHGDSISSRSNPDNVATLNRLRDWIPPVDTFLLEKFGCGEHQWVASPTIHTRYANIAMFINYQHKAFAANKMAFNSRALI
jgi:hypothetical protein